jgi:hypothetical protein
VLIHIEPDLAVSLRESLDSLVEVGDTLVGVENSADRWMHYAKHLAIHYRQRGVELTGLCLHAGVCTQVEHFTVDTVVTEIGDAELMGLLLKIGSLTTTQSPIHENHITFFH